jgi:hypothetical protein
MCWQLLLKALGDIIRLFAGILLNDFRTFW